jgi:hypothetical protein
MGTLRRNRKGVPAEIKSAKLKKKGELVSDYKHRLMIMKWINEKDICLISITYDNKMVPTRVRGQDAERPNVIIDYNSGMGGVDLSDAYMTSYRSTRKRIKNIIRSTSVI